jgi:hypothetical protein
VDEDDLITPDETATILRKSVRTLPAWHRRGYGPPRIKIGGKVFYRRSSVLRWLAEQEQAPVGTDAV